MGDLLFNGGLGGFGGPPTPPGPSFGPLDAGMGGFNGGLGGAALPGVSYGFSCMTCSALPLPLGPCLQGIRQISC